MNKKQWIAIFLVLVLCLTMFSGCKTNPQEDEFGVVETPVNGAEGTDKDEKPKDETVQKPAQTPDEEKKEPAEKEPVKDEKPSAGNDPVKDEPAKKPDEGTKDPADNNTKEPVEEKPKEEPLPPITKEESGTPITFLMQNLRTAGNQKGLDINEYGGGTLNLYRRKYRFKQLVLKQEPDVILAAEATPGWLDFFATDPYMSQTYTCVWAYRRPGSAVEMATPVLYKTAKYAALESGHFWYSNTPKFSSPTFGYSVADGETHYRHCSWVKLKDKNTGAVFNAYSIHFDAGNEEVGYKSMNLLLERFKALGEDGYAFIGGDFNFGFRDKYYDLAVDMDYQVDLQNMAANMKEDGLCEIGGANGSLHSKYEAGFPDPNPGRKRQLDHIMAKLHPNMAVDYWGFDYTDYEDPEHQVEKGYISDHYGLVCKVRIGTDVDYSRYHYEHKGELAAAER